MSLFKHRYFLFGIGIYIVSVAYLHFIFQQSLTDLLIPFLIIGIGFSFIGWWMTRKLVQPFQQPAVKKELWVLIALTFWIIFYITYGGNLVNKILPADWIENPPVYSIIIFLRKLVFFVLIPFAIYKFLGFSLSDFGLNKSPIKFFTQKINRYLFFAGNCCIMFSIFL